MQTIEIIPHYRGVDHNGAEVSPFSAGISYIEATGKWTYRVTDSRGNVTVGMCRRPADTYSEALAVAKRAAEVSGARVIEPKE